MLLRKDRNISILLIAIALNDGTYIRSTKNRLKYFVKRYVLANL